MEQTIRAMLLDLDPPVYQWTTQDDEIAEDAIMVGSGGRSVEMVLAGLTYMEPTASIYWRVRVTAKGMVEAGGEMSPWRVKVALARAEELRNQMGQVFSSDSPHRSPRAPRSGARRKHTSCVPRPFPRR